MLSKLLKHEMKACARLLLPLYIILFVLTIMDRIVLSLKLFDGSLAIIPGFITFIYVLAIVAIIIVSIVFIVFRFYKNLVTDEGYLMFTLPVKAHQLINSKLISSLIWIFISLTAVISSIFAVVITGDKMKMIRDAFHESIESIRIEFGDLSTLFMIELLLMLVLSIIYAILLVYTSISAGQLFNGHKLMLSFAAYAVINTATQIVGIILSLAADFVFSNKFSETEGVVLIVLPLMLLFLLIFSAIYYAASNYIFKKKLNLE